MMAFFEPEDANVPVELKGYLKTQAEQKRLGLAARFEKLFRSLYFDTAGTGAWAPALEAAFNIASADRIMFGTDYPLECKTAANIIEALDVVRAAARSNEDRSAILGKTAASLFKLP
jgi:predicted TIM-barrel fold metal-dependent hydrolase